MRNTRLAYPPRSRIERPLMCRGIKQAGIGGENVLCSVAMMDIEIHHGNALKTMHGARMKCSDRDIVEHAEPHRLRRRGVMPGRAHSTKRVLHFARHDHVDGEYDPAGSAKGRITSSRRCESVGIETHESGFRYRSENVTDVGLRMCASERFEAGFRRFPADQPRKFGSVED